MRDCTHWFGLESMSLSLSLLESMSLSLSLTKQIDTTRVSK